jgi:hypothetical protein
MNTRNTVAKGTVWCGLSKSPTVPVPALPIFEEPRVYPHPCESLTTRRTTTTMRTMMTAMSRRMTTTARTTTTTAPPLPPPPPHFALCNHKQQSIDHFEAPMRVLEEEGARGGEREGGQGQTRYAPSDDGCPCRFMPMGFLFIIIYFINNNTNIFTDFKHRYEVPHGFHTTL